MDKSKDKNSVVLVIPDLQIPFHNSCAAKFLNAIKLKFKPTRVICIGDETDNHAFGQYDKDPDLPSPGQEIKDSIDALQEIYNLFQEVEVINSNHKDRIENKLIKSGIPRALIKKYESVMKAPPKWSWKDSLKITLPNNQKTLFIHGRTKDLSWLKSTGLNIVQGHFHEEFSIKYYKINDDSKGIESQRWIAFTGCLIDNQKLAFKYNKNNKYAPILGALIIIDGFPQLIPMILNSNGKWIGKL